jgi:hypothetical protein
MKIGLHKMKFHEVRRVFAAGYWDRIPKRNAHLVLAIGKVSVIG